MIKTNINLKFKGKISICFSTKEPIFMILKVIQLQQGQYVSCSENN